MPVSGIIIADLTAILQNSWICANMKGVESSMICSQPWFSQHFTHNCYSSHHNALQLYSYIIIPYRLWAPSRNDYILIILLFPCREQETGTEWTVWYMFINFNWMKTLKVPSWFTDGTKLKETANPLHVRIKKRQKVLDKLEQWARAYTMKVNRGTTNAWNLEFLKKLCKNRRDLT